MILSAGIQVLILLRGWKKVYFALKQRWKNTFILRKNAGISFKFMLDTLLDKVNFKIYDLTTWLTNDYTMHIAQYLTM